MRILFKTDDLAHLCQEEKIMLRKIGKAGSRQLRARLADLDAAENMSQVKRGRPHPLKREFVDCLGLDLDGGRRLVLEVAQDPIPTSQDGSIDWRQVKEVRVVYIGDYHD